MAYVIAEPCIGTKDTACVDACPVDCIHPKKDEADHGSADQLFIDPVECIDCGACEPACPVDAIYADRKLPEDKQAFLADNAQFFTMALPDRDGPIGTPGGSQVIGPVAADAELTGNWPAA